MRTTSLTALLFSLTAGLALASPATDLWPLHQGDSWTYASTTFPGSADKVIRSNRAIERGGGRLVQLDGLFGNRWWWLSHSSGHVYIWNPGSQTSTLAFDLNATPGRQFRVDIPEGGGCIHNSRWEVQGTDEAVSTTAGDFLHCTVIRIVRDGACADAGYTQFSFSPEVGLVEYRMGSLLGASVWSLKSAVVEGRSYPSSSFSGGVSVCAATDRHRYRSNNQSPAVLRARLELKNESAESVPFGFDNSQDYDFLVQDGSGREVLKWSQGRSFVWVASQLNFFPGEEWSYAESLLLQDHQGRPLPPGDYTLIARHMGQPLRFEGRVRFRIER